MTTLLVGCGSGSDSTKTATSGPTTTAAPEPANTECGPPAQFLNLTNWKITVPTGTQGSPTEVMQPQLATYVLPPWFQVASGCSGVQFRAPVNAPTTGGSDNPRSELREMTNNGTQQASWSSTQGTHTMVINQAVTTLPAGKPQVVAGQIHNATDDISVFRLEGSKLYVTNGEDDHYQLLDDGYRLGTKFEAKFVVGGGKIEAYYNGALKATITKDFGDSFFKAGVYTQANCRDTKPCDSGNYGQVVIYDVTVTHT